MGDRLSISSDEKQYTRVVKVTGRLLCGLLVSSHLSEPVGLGEWLVGHVLELRRDRVGAPSRRVVLDGRRAEASTHLELFTSRSTTNLNKVPSSTHSREVNFLNSKFQFLNLSNNQSIECRKLRRNFQKTMSFLNTEGTTADSRTERQRGWRGQSRLEADCCKENRAIRAAFSEISDKTIEPLVV